MALAQPLSTQRIRSIDILRGAVMLIMAIDHVRVYSGVPSWSTDYGIFFTRWITNFCAPAFAFFAGTSAFLYGRKLASKGALSRYLFSRGLLLVILELTLIRLFWTFNLNFGDFTLAGIIWMLGWCMVLMAALIWLPPPVVGILGVLIIFLQHAFSLVPNLLPAASHQHFGWIWSFIYPSKFDPWRGIAILYVIVPWIGVMMAGYGFGLVVISDPAKRAKVCLWIGVVSIVAFFLLAYRAVIPQYFKQMPFIQQMLGQRKYPASPVFLLMTLGPVILLIPFAEKWKGKFVGVLETVGKVPFFYYILHILLIHLAALVTDFVRDGIVSPPWYSRAPYVEMEPQDQWPLWLLYLNYFCIVFILYWPCRWYARYKREHPEKKWLRYL